MHTITLLNAALLAYSGYALTLSTDAKVEEPTYPGDDCCNIYEWQNYGGSYRNLCTGLKGRIDLVNWEKSTGGNWRNEI